MSRPGQFEFPDRHPGRGWWQEEPGMMLAALVVGAVAAVLGGGMMLLFPMAVLVAAALLGYWGMGIPRYVSLAETGVRIVYPLRRRLIRYDQIAGAELVPLDRMKLSHDPGSTVERVREQLREKYGELEVLATRPTDYLLLRRREGAHLLIGVADAAGLLRELTAGGRIPSPESEQEPNHG